MKPKSHSGPDQEELQILKEGRLFPFDLVADELQDPGDDKNGQRGRPDGRPAGLAISDNQRQKDDRNRQHPRGQRGGKPDVKDQGGDQKQRRDVQVIGKAPHEAGIGIDHSRPNTLSMIAGMQIQWISSLAGL